MSKRARDFGIYGDSEREQNEGRDFERVSRREPTEAGAMMWVRSEMMNVHFRALRNAELWKLRSEAAEKILADHQ